MESAERVHYESRVYSAARMKRRAGRVGKENGGRVYARKDSTPELTNRAYTESPFHLSNREASEREDFAMKPEVRFTAASLDQHRAGESLRPTLNLKNLSYQDFENFMSPRNSFYEVMSIDNSEGSNEAVEKQDDVRMMDWKVESGKARQMQKNKILATLLPDEILGDPVSQKNRHYHIVLMFPDVSGFSQLCQKYDKTGKGGPSRLTEVLNGYIGSMIEIVLSMNGDVCKFGGDAFLCVWKVTEDLSIMEIVHLAIESAVNIQKNCGEHETDVGVKLMVKIAVAAGNAIFSIVGTETRKYYVIAGPPVMEVRDAEQMCGPGEVIVTPSAWQYINNYMLYSYTYHSDNVHIKVHDFGPLWKSMKPSLKKKVNSNELVNLRPFLKYALSLKVEDVRPFILPPIMRSIDLNQSLDYLTEMRQVAIAFFNVEINMKEISQKELLRLINKSFGIVSSVVDSNDGATNKLTLFDKDLAILTVFGLKGFKHELASQVALKCAHNCVEQLKTLNVPSASAGVTTGMVYCGVIGHPLRKEYTVMGHPVNMAARLMCAYTNIVSSDRETFLYSKLESSHFEVLEHKSLKGIQNAGPFYKFILRPKRSKQKADNDPYPLLGRGKEISEFEDFIKGSVKKDDSPNFMVIYGEARIGKSRLVARLLNIAEKKSTGTSEISLKKGRISRRRGVLLETCFIPLTEDVSKTSYSTGRLIFLHLLGLSESSSVEEKQDKILSKLVEKRDLFLLASLNPVFNVNFELMPQYLALNEFEQLAAQITLLKSIYGKCFPKGDKWLIVIDDAELMDEESWTLLEHCSKESNKVLYLVTIGQRKALSTAALQCLKTIKAQTITLTQIEKWYYAGLACQILGVRSIPLELINLLQNCKSSGNPGWLESFLLSLLQSGSIYISQMPYHEVKTMRLLTVPEIMLSRNPMIEAEKFDHSYWMECVENFEEIADLKSKTIRICLLGPNFFVASNNENELTMDVMFIKTVDTLKPLQKLLLKAGSVVGNYMKRSALKFLVSKDMSLAERPLAKAIKQLFEIKILTCAKGDSSSSNLLIPKKITSNPTGKNEIFCECTGLSIPLNCRDLPKYANCSYMQFRLTTFRDTIYNLLLDDQKKKFHYSYIEFLKKNTYRCKSCNSVPFSNVLGYEEDSQVLACTKSPIHGVRSTKLNPNSNFPMPSIQKKLASCSFMSPAHRIRNSTRNSENDFSQAWTTDFGDCQCAKILSSVYSVLLEHAAGCGRKDLTLEIRLEYASVSLTSYNIPLTMQILEEALSLVNQMKEEKEFPELCSPYIYGKIYALMGATKLSMGRPNDSLELLTTCLRCLGKSFPRNSVAVRLAIKKQTLRRRLLMEFPDSYIGKVSEEKAPLTDLLSECLGLISLVHMYMQDWPRANCASVWALNKALESNRNFFGLCTAYTNMMETAYRDHDVSTCARMELCAIDTCKRCNKQIVEVYELEAVCRLYRVIFQMRYVRAEIEEAANIGFQSIKIASTIRSTTLRLDVMPDLILALIQLNRLSEAVALLRELEFMSLPESDKSTKVWYHAISLDFQLDTGFTVLPFETCEEFAREEEISLARDTNAQHRLFTSLWLWCLRNSEWQMSKSYEKALRNFSIGEGKENPCTVATLLKRLEGSLIMLVHRMDSRNIHSINSTYLDIYSLMNKLEKDVKVVKLLKPRYQLLKAYYRQIRYRDNSYYRIFNQTLIQAEKIKDKNTFQWITHLKMVWSNAISPIQRDYWIEHSRYNLIDWHESDKVSKAQTVMYSLPLPKY